jgi:Fur family ferric uptake transcriptional regulator
MSATSAHPASAVRSTEPLEVLRAYIVENGLKSSRQREVIAEAFFKAGGHLRVEELLDRVRAIDSRIGQATVYRTMKLLTQCGLAEAHQFGDGHTVYEPVDEPEEHHDHLICTSCGAIVEFFSEKIESLQSDIARQHGYDVTSHKMELYGICPACLARDKKTRRV